MINFFPPLTSILFMYSFQRNQPISHAERMALNEQDSSLTNTISVTDKFSPSTLERKLRAEVNQLETMDDALRQITDIERVRGVSIAQQETVSLAQILKVVIQLFVFETIEIEVLVGNRSFTKN